MASFNPCFVGFPFRTGYHVLNHVARYKQFQSLFCWISVSDSHINNFFLIRFGGFNPCFVGFPFRTTGKLPLSRTVDKFQSLFCWISVSDTAYNGTHKQKN